jgi:hypothetical protein
MTPTPKPPTPRQIVADLKERFERYDAADYAATYAYCDTSFENFDGNYSEFQESRNRSVTDALESFQQAMTKAATNPAVVALIKAEGGQLANYLPDDPKPAPATRRAAAPTASQRSFG